MSNHHLDPDKHRSKLRQQQEAWKERMRPMVEFCDKAGGMAQADEFHVLVDTRLFAVAQREQPLTDAEARKRK